MKKTLYDLKCDIDVGAKWAIYLEVWRTKINTFTTTTNNKFYFYISQFWNYIFKKEILYLDVNWCKGKTIILLNIVIHFVNV